MFIKQIIIQGFKSYKEQVVVGVLSPEHNVVVGHNGSGKSNLFSAIEFVLNGDKTFKQQKNRLSLLHEGGGPQVLSAYVEIVFDNSDRTFPIDSREVSLRRVISMKKDQFFLNKKTVTKHDVTNLLGSAGLANCHPYYIVKQGKVTELAEAPESFRLELVKKVAGVRTCENRCNQTVNCFEGLSRRGEKVDRTIESITELKETLNGMSEELGEFQRLDKLKRGLHFVLSEKQLRAYERKLRHIRAQLEETGHSALGVRLHQVKENAVAASKQLWKLKEQIRAAKEKENNLQLRISELRLERTRSRKHLDELKEGRNSHKTEKESIQRELEEAREAFADTETTLASLQARLDELQQFEEGLSKEFQTRKEELDFIETRHVRSKQYRTKEERNIAIEKTLEVLQLEIQNLKETAADRAEEMRKMKETQVSLERDVVEQQERRTTLKNMESSLSDLKGDLKKLKGEKMTILNKKNKEEQELSTLRNAFEREERGFRSMASKVILDGINSVGRILDGFRHDNDGSKRLIADQYYGLVIDHFSCDEVIETAVEVTAGGSLFHHIVATVQVANEILMEMNRLNLPGEVSFLPVESLILRPFSYPITQVALPLVSKLMFEDCFDNVYKKIFGSTLICQSLDVAVELARRNRIDCVTFGGDQVSRHGWLMGGYVDPHRSRFKLYQARKAWLKQIEDTQTKIKRLEDDLNEADKAYNEVVSNVAKKTLGIEVFKSDSQVINARLDHQKLATLDLSLKEKKESLDHVWILLDTLSFKATKLEEELTQDLPSVLPLDKERCSVLNRELMQIQGRRDAALGKLKVKRNQKNLLLEALKDNSVERLKRDVEEIDLENDERLIEKSTSELESLSLLLLSTKEELKEQSAGLQVLLKQERAQQMEFDKLETVKYSLSEEMKQALSHPKALQVDEVEYKQKIQDLKEKMEEMGPVPNGVETFATWNTRKVLAELDKVKAELRGYEHVTTRALAPVANVLRIVDEMLLLVQKFRTLFQSVKNSSRMSEQLKDNALRIAFRTVRRHFKEVFQRFVPNGRGKLHLIETSPADSGNGEHSIAGVLVKVSFPGGQPSQEMRQLSAGQKSVVALALIFALQKCNPSPFYILDEIDHALDLQYRQTLALVVREMKAYSQFITITFRPELLQYADNFLGLKYCNKQSYIGSLAKEEALKIVTKVHGTGH